MDAAPPGTARRTSARSRRVPAARADGQPASQILPEIVVEAGLAHLEKHLENAAAYGLRAVVAINVFPDDGEEEIALVAKAALPLTASVPACTLRSSIPDNTLSNFSRNVKNGNKSPF